ncbi:hypothetical protein Bwad005_34490 [Bilophila wadsworthia]
MRESDEGLRRKPPRRVWEKPFLRGKEEGEAHQALGVAVKKKRGKRKMISPLPCFG